MNFFILFLGTVLLLAVLSAIGRGKRGAEFRREVLVGIAQVTIAVVVMLALVFILFF